MQTVEMAALNIPGTEEVFGSGPVLPPLPRWQVALLIAGGGAVGAVLRFLLQLLLPSTTTPTLVEMPWSTLLANTLGCLAMGLLAGGEVIGGVPRARQWHRPRDARDGVPPPRGGIVTVGYPLEFAPG